MMIEKLQLLVEELELESILEKWEMLALVLALLSIGVTAQRLEQRHWYKGWRGPGSGVVWSSNCTGEISCIWRDVRDGAF